MATRGLPTDRTMLFLVDWVAALRRAISDIYGVPGVVRESGAKMEREAKGADVRTARRLDARVPIQTFMHRKYLWWQVFLLRTLA